ncbi:MAG: Lrp/AsnC family transcriptional regulator, partial [Pseudomonadales bacterium]
IIEGYSVKINRSKLARGIEAIVMVLIANKAYKETLAEIEKMQTVQSVRSLSGEWDWAVYVAARSLEEFQETITAINELDGIKGTVSHIVIDTKLDKRAEIGF